MNSTEILGGVPVPGPGYEVPFQYALAEYGWMLLIAVAVGFGVFLLVKHLNI